MEKVGIAQIIKYIRENYNENEDKEKWQKQFDDKYKEYMQKNYIDIKFDKYDNTKLREADELNIFFRDDNIREELKYNVTSRKEGYYILISDLFNNRIRIFIGQGESFFKRDYKGYNKHIYLINDSSNKQSQEEKDKIVRCMDEMSEYLFSEAKKLAEAENKNIDFGNVYREELILPNISDEELLGKVNKLRIILSKYTTVMKSYLSNHEEKKEYYENLIEKRNEVMLEEASEKDKKADTKTETKRAVSKKTDKIFAIFNYVYLDEENGLKWSFSKKMQSKLNENENSENNEFIEDNKEANDDNKLYEDIKDTNVHKLSKLPTKNTIFYGVPGSGKSHFIENALKEEKVDENRYVRVTFYQEYTYTDFIGTYKIVGNEIKPVAGPFTEILKTSMSTNKKCYLIIEEMNRGNAESIFDDIFQLLDREYSTSNQFIKDCLKLQESRIKLPSNLIILATINTSDQNVFNLDTAFGRRWEYENVNESFYKEKNIEIPEKYKTGYIKGFNTKWEEFRTAINERILDSENIWNKEDKQLGRFYIKSDMLETEEEHNNNEDEDKKIYRKSFLNKVMRYLWNDVFKNDKTEISDLINENNVNSLEKLINVLDGEEKLNKFFIKADNTEIDIEESIEEN